MNTRQIATCGGHILWVCNSGSCHYSGPVCERHTQDYLQKIEACGQHEDFRRVVNDPRCQNPACIRLGHCGYYGCQR